MSTKRVSEMTDDEIRDLCGSRNVPEDSARDAANRVAEAVRMLNYLSLPHDGAPGLTQPSDVYDVIGSLKTAMQRMPQLLSQLAEWLAAGYAAGDLAHDSGGSVLQAVSLTDDSLSGAAQAAGQMETFLADAHNASSRLKAAR